MSGPPEQIIQEDPQEFAKQLPVIRDKLYEEIATEMMQEPIDEDDIVQKTLNVMQRIEKDTTKTGIQKQVWVIAVVRKIVEMNPLLSEQKRAILLNFIDKSLPSIINAIISASQGLTELNKKYGCCDKDGCLLTCCSGFWTCLCPCFGGKNCNLCSCA